MKETAYSLCRIINHNDLAAIKSLTNKDLSDIELLKYKESYSIKEHSIQKILNKVVVCTLLSKC